LPTPTLKAVGKIGKQEGKKDVYVPGSIINQVAFFWVGVFLYDP
jgi:hypothetical protein